MAKMIDLRTEEEKRYSTTPEGILLASIRDKVWKLSEMIGALRTTAQVAVMSSMMMEHYAVTDRPEPMPTRRYRDFVGRAAPLPRRKATPATEALRRSIWKRVRKFVELVGPNKTMHYLILLADLAVASERDWDGLKPGPETRVADFAKRADGTRLL